MKYVLTLLIVSFSLSACNEPTPHQVSPNMPLDKRSVATEYRIDTTTGQYVKCYSKLAGKIQQTYELEVGQKLDLVPGSTIIEYKNEVWLHVSPKGYKNTCYVKTAYLEPVTTY